MREIKFRAWDEKSKKMIPDSDVYWVLFSDGTIHRSNTYCQGGTEEWVWGCDWEEDCEDIILMQYIGRNDDNGIEIYEGDLLKDGQGNIGKVFYHKESASYRVNWHRKDGTWETDSCIGYGVVVGNIYDNPEILGG